MLTPKLTSFLEALPHTRYHGEWRLLTWHPGGILDDTLADEIIGEIHADEQFEPTPSHRYIDFSGLTTISLQIGHVFQIAEHRRQAREPVRSAFFAPTATGFGMARLYEEAMHGAMIQVRVFRERSAAAEWLGVPVKIPAAGSQMKRLGLRAFNG